MIPRYSGKESSMKKRSNILALALAVSLVFSGPAPVTPKTAFAGTTTESSLYFSSKKISLRAGCRAQFYVYGWYNNLKVYSEDPDIVSVNRNGILKGKKKGTTALIAKDTTTGATARCKVTVSKKLTQTQIRSRLYKLKTGFPEGKTWTNANLDAYGNGGCYAFMTIALESVFGKNALTKQHSSFKKIRVGDHIRIGNYHSVVVLKKKAHSVIVAEGNYNSSIHWGREITKQELQATGFYVDTYIW